MTEPHPFQAFGPEASGRDRADGDRILDRRGHAPRWLRGLFVAPDPEDELDWRLEGIGRRLTRANHLVFASPKGGVGKTTCTLLVGDQLASTARLRCVAVDTDPGYGTLGSLPPEELRCERSLSDLLRALDELDTAAAMRPFVSLLPSGLHVLAARTGAHPAGEVSVEDYGRLFRWLGRFYEVVLLDLGTDLSDPLARLALQLGDQTVVVTTPELITVERALLALDDLAGTVDPRSTTLVLNRAPTRRDRDLQLVQAILRQADVAERITLPDDPRLGAALDAGTYHVDDLHHRTRLAVKQLALCVAEALR